MADDETATLETLTSHRSIITRLVERHDGRVVDSPGDALLAEFVSPVEAVACAVEIQRELARRNAQLILQRRMDLRIGVNLGDIIERDGSLYGSGVNVAARLEALAEAGGICVSRAVYDQVEGKLDVAFDDLGDRDVKNIPKPVRVYRVRIEAGGGERPPSFRAKRRRSTALLIGAGALVVLFAALGAWLGRDFVAQRVSRTQPQGYSDHNPILAIPKGPGVAVLPFANLSGDGTQDTFADGLTEDILSGLSRYHDLKVVGRTSTLLYKNKAVDPREVGRALGVRYVLEGSVRRAGDRLRVTAQLLDAHDGSHLWAETFDRNLSLNDIFRIQDEVTEKVVTAIATTHGVIRRSEFAATRDKGAENLSSYECVQRGRQYPLNPSKANHAEVRACLERAVEADPNYADAWALLAFMHMEEHFQGYNPRPGSSPVDRMMDAAQRAVSLDPTSATAQQMLGNAHFLKGELSEFRVVYDRALALNPNDPMLLALYSVFLSYIGDFDHALPLIRKAIEISPVHPGWYYFPFFYSQYAKGEYDQALATVDKMQLPNFWQAHLFRAATLGQLGRREDAQAALARTLELNPAFATDPRSWYLRRNMTPERVERLMDGLRKAGLTVPPSAK
jgi:TolB-like protein